MEAVPRLPMLSFELKTSPEYVDFGPVLKQYIRDNYGEDPAHYNKACSDLEQLRQSAVHVSHDFMGCSTLKKYYAQLQFLQGRFPMTEGGQATMPFTWDDLFMAREVTLADIKFEQASVLYNIGSLHSILGAMETRQNADGMKVSCTHFQCAAWAYEYLRDHFGSAMMSHDFSHDLLTYHVYLMLAQAQECILEKSMIDSRKSSITAKVAKQIVDFCTSALKALDPAHKDGIVSSSRFKQWKKRIELKMLFYTCITNFYMGKQSEEQQKWGECLAYYTMAYNKLTECIKMGKNESSDIQESLRFANDVIQGKYQSAKKDNDFVYHEKVPEFDTLPEVKGAPLVKGIPFNPNDPEISGPDFFQKLVPMEAHEASSLYSEEKAKLLREICGEIEDKNTKLMQFMSSLGLDQSKLDNLPEKLPQQLLEKCAAVSVKANAVKDLVDAMGAVSNVATDVDLAIKDIYEMLDNEDKEEGKFQEQFGKRSINPNFDEIRKEVSRFEEGHKKGSQSNADLHKAMNTHITNLRLLGGPIEDINNALPAVSKEKAPDDEAVLQNLRRLLSKVDEMKQQRGTLEEQFRHSVRDDDITNSIVTQEGVNKQVMFENELKKHDKVIGLIRQNLSAQENILSALTDANVKYASIRRASEDTTARREAMIQELINSYNVYEDLLAKSQKGQEFYKKLLGNVSRLAARCRELCQHNMEEREKFLEKYKPKVAPPRPEARKPEQGAPVSTQIAPGTVSQDAPAVVSQNSPASISQNAPAAITHDSSESPSMPLPPILPSTGVLPGFDGPKLKDYLPFMKPKTFGKDRKQPKGSSSLPGSHSGSPVHTIKGPEQPVSRTRDDISLPHDLDSYVHGQLDAASVPDIHATNWPPSSYTPHGHAHPSHNATPQGHTHPSLPQGPAIPPNIHHENQMHVAGTLPQQQIASMYSPAFSVHSQYGGSAGVIAPDLTSGYHASMKNTPVSSASGQNLHSREWRDQNLPSMHPSTQNSQQQYPQSRPSPSQSPQINPSMPQHYSQMRPSPSQSPHSVSGYNTAETSQFQNLGMDQQFYGQMVSPASQMHVDTRSLRHKSAHPLPPQADQRGPGVLPQGSQVVSGIVPQGSQVVPGIVPQGSQVVPGIVPQGSQVLPGIVPQGSQVLPGIVPQGSQVATGIVLQGGQVGPGMVPQGSQVAPGIVPQGSQVAPGIVPQGSQGMPGTVSQGSQTGPGIVSQGSQGAPGIVNQASIAGGTFHEGNTFGSYDIPSQDSVMMYSQQSYVAPQGHMSQPQGQISQPQGQMQHSQGQISQPQGQMSQPQGQMSQPQGQMSHSQGQMSHSQGQMSLPQGQMSQPRGQLSQPQGQLNSQGQMPHSQGQMPHTSIAHSQGQGHHQSQVQNLPQAQPYPLQGLYQGNTNTVSTIHTPVITPANSVPPFHQHYSDLPSSSASQTSIQSSGVGSQSASQNMPGIQDSVNQQQTLTSQRQNVPMETDYQPGQGQGQIQNQGPGTSGQGQGLMVNQQGIQQVNQQSQNWQYSQNQPQQGQTNLASQGHTTHGQLGQTNQIQPSSSQQQVYGSSLPTQQTGSFGGHQGQMSQQGQVQMSNQGHFGHQAQQSVNIDQREQQSQQAYTCSQGTQKTNVQFGQQQASRDQMQPGAQVQQHQQQQQPYYLQGQQHMLPSQQPFVQNLAMSTSQQQVQKGQQQQQSQQPQGQMLQYQQPNLQTSQSQFQASQSQQWKQQSGQTQYHTGQQGVLQPQQHQQPYGQVATTQSQPSSQGQGYVQNKQPGVAHDMQYGQYNQQIQQPVQKQQPAGQIQQQQQQFGHNQQPVGQIQQPGIQSQQPSQSNYSQGPMQPPFNQSQQPASQQQFSSNQIQQQPFGQMQQSPGQQGYVQMQPGHAQHQQQQQFPGKVSMVTGQQPSQQHFGSAQQTQVTGPGTNQGQGQMFGGQSQGQTMGYQHQQQMPPGNVMSKPLSPDVLAQGILPSPLQPQATKSIENLDPPSKPQTPSKDVPRSGGTGRKEKSHSRQLSTSSNTSLDDILSSSPREPTDEKSDTMLTPKVLTEQEKQQQKEEAILKSSSLNRQSSRDPYSDPLLKDRFVGETEKFAKYVESLGKATCSGPTNLDIAWKELIEEQEKGGKKTSMAIARCYPAKNREVDVMPYDQTRVVLTTQKDDYINASWLTDLSPCCPKFIATQSPLPVTLTDFWVAVYEQGSEVIVMLTSEAETGKKYPEYWPSKKGQPEHYGPIQLTLQSEKDKNNWIERIVYLNHLEKKQARTIVQLQYKNWPVSGFPDNISHLLQFITTVHNFYRQQRSLMKPVIVHCGNGIGRTGVFMLVYAGMQEMDHGMGIINILDVAKKMFMQRRLVIKEKYQLKYVYEAILYYAQDILAKQGILVHKASFGDKLPQSKSKSNQWTPTEDILFGTTMSLNALQSNVAKMGLHIGELQENKSESEMGKIQSLKESVTQDTVISPAGQESCIERLSENLPDVVQRADPKGKSGVDPEIKSGVNVDAKENVIQSDKINVDSPKLSRHGSEVSLKSLESGSHKSLDSESIKSLETGSVKSLGSGSVSHESSPIHKASSVQGEGCSMKHLSLADLQDPKTFTVGTSEGSKKKITKASFEGNKPTLSDKVDDPSDPLSSLDPLWSLKK